MKILTTFEARPDVRWITDHLYFSYNSFTYVKQADPNVYHLKMTEAYNVRNVTNKAIKIRKTSQKNVSNVISCDISYRQHRQKGVQNKSAIDFGEIIRHLKKKKSSENLYWWFSFSEFWSFSIPHFLIFFLISPSEVSLLFVSFYVLSKLHESFKVETFLYFINFNFSFTQSYGTNYLFTSFFFIFMQSIVGGGHNHIISHTFV